MATKNVIFALLALVGTVFGQSAALFIDSNSVITPGRNVTFNGSISFSQTNQAAITRSNLSLGLPALTNSTGSALLSALGGMTTNGNAAGLTNFPASILQTNSSDGSFPLFLLRTNGSASELTNFPASVLLTNSATASFPSFLLRTNGDGSGLTNLPNANLSNAIGVLPISNGGSGATNQADARTAFGLGSAATNDASAFQPASSALTNLAAGDGSALTNVVVTDASTLTNFPAELLRTNGSAAALTSFPSELLRTNGDGSGLSNVSVDLTTVLPAYSNNALKVLAVASGETNVEWIAVSNTVTDASTLTNFPASILQTNSADGSFPVFLARTNSDASGFTNFPTFNQNTTGTASNVTGVVAIANGGSGASDVTNARINLLPSYTGNENRILALNSNATDVIWTTNTGGGSGSVTSVAMTVPSFLSVSGSPITNSGTLSVTLSGTALPVANGGTGTTSAGNQLQANLGFYSAGSFWTKLGGNANAGNTAVAIGYEADALGSASVAIGGYAYATNSYSVSLGYQSTSKATSVSVGYKANADGTNAIQLGTGTNASTSTIQFINAGSVNSTQWGYLANASAQGGYAMTNTAAISTNISVVGTNNTNTLVFSNGILVEVQ